jgi:hypothetical protein
MLAEAYHTFFAAKIPDRFVMMAKAMGVDTDALPEEERSLAFIKAYLNCKRIAASLILKCRTMESKGENFLCLRKMPAKPWEDFLNVIPIP